MREQKSFTSLFSKVSFSIAAIAAITACNNPGSGEFDPNSIDQTNATTHQTNNYGVCWEAALAEAWDFNVFVLGDYTAPSADVEGRLAVGGNAYISNYSIGDKLDFDALRKDLIVAGNLNFPSGAVLKGRTLYGGTLTSTGAATSFGGFFNQSSPINFTNVGIYLKTMSTTLGTLIPNATVTFTNVSSRHDTMLSGSDPILNVFQMTTDDLERSDYLDLTIPSGSTALINVMGNSISIAQFAMQFHGADTQHVVFNFPTATSIYLGSISFEGSILAPFADTTFSSGQFNGQFIGQSMYGQGQFNGKEFAGCLPYGAPPTSPTPTPSPSATPGPTATPSPTPTPGGDNCTFTIGYWKNHKAAITPNLPQMLGTTGSAKTFSVISTTVAVDILKQNVYGDPSNGITKLYAQLLAAKLNASHGASIGAISTEFANSDAFLATHDYNDWNSLSPTEQANVLSWHDTIDQFNNGIVGPGHCGSDEY